MAKITGKILMPAALFCAAASIAVYIAAVALAGGSVFGVFVFAATSALLVLMPGLLVCRLFMPGLKGAALVPAAAVSGSLILVICYVIFGWLGNPFLAGIIPLAAGIYYVFTRRKTLLKTNIKAVPAPLWLLLMLFSGLLVMYSFSGLMSYAKPSMVGVTTFSHDMLWSTGNAAAVQFGFPLRDIRVAGGVLHYHYYSEIVSGILAMLSGQLPWDVCSYYVWPYWAAVICLALWALSRRMGLNGYASLFAPFGVLVLHYFHRQAIEHTFLNMNNLVQYTAFFSTTLLLIRENERTGFKNYRSMPIVLAGMFSLMWSKSTVGFLLLLALAAALLVYGAVHRKVLKWPMVFIGISGLFFALLYILLLGKATNTMTLQESFIGAARFKMGVMMRQYWPVVAVYIMSLVFSLVNFKKLAFTDLAINAMTVGGLIAVSMFFHYSGSDQYFLLASTFLMWLCIARTLPWMFKLKWPAIAAGGLCLAALGGMTIMFLPMMYNGYVQAGRSLGLRPAAERVEESISPDDEAAALWLRQNMKQDEVFAVNRNDKVRVPGEGVFHFYTAMSGRQAYMEGWQYGHTYTFPRKTMVYMLETVSDGIFRCETFNQASAMAKEHGIDYLLLYLPKRGEPFEGGTPVFKSDDVLIYKVQ